MIVLYTSDKEFEILHKAADKGGKGTTCEIPKAKLRHLLMDHSQMYAALENIGEEILNK
jgi:hypothetical protein